MKDSEEVRNAKSLFKEYNTIKKRLNFKLSSWEEAYTQNMLNRIHSRINFSLLGDKKKTETDKYNYDENRDYRRERRY